MAPSKIVPFYWQNSRITRQAWFASCEFCQKWYCVRFHWTARILDSSKHNKQCPLTKRIYASTSSLKIIQHFPHTNEWKFSQHCTKRWQRVDHRLILIKVDNRLILDRILVIHSTAKKINNLMRWLVTRTKTKWKQMFKNTEVADEQDCPLFGI